VIGASEPDCPATQEVGTIGQMVYVAFLRGINVGGNNPVSMARLKATFEDVGFGTVKTYINSGNVVFTARAAKPATLAHRIEKAIEQNLGIAIAVTVRDLASIENLVDSLPAAWVTDQHMRCDVMFLWDEFDRPSIVKGLPATPAIEDLRYSAGAVIWRIDRANAAKTRMTKLIGTPLYKGMTARNANTVRKLLALMRDATAR
jgi:uncharacterized protein (DUF1697 family)